MKPAITKKMEIEDLVRNYPESIRYLSEKNINCIACGEPIWGSLEEAAKEKGYSDSEIEDMVATMNEQWRSM